MVYLYCITDAKVQDLENIVVEQRRLINYDSFIVFAAEKSDFRPEYPQNIMTHYQINDQILRNGFTVLPFAYGTIIPANYVNSFVKENIENIKQKLIEFKGKVEIGIKIMVLIQEDQTQKLLKTLSDTPGHKYLSQCLLKYAPFLVGSETMESLRRDIDKYLGPHCVRSKTKIHNHKKVLINNAFLVENGSLKSFYQAYEELKKLYPKCGFLISGPWPAYNFIYLRGNVPVEEGNTCGISCPN